MSESPLTTLHDLLWDIYLRDDVISDHCWDVIEGLLTRAQGGKGD